MKFTDLNVISAIKQTKDFHLANSDCHLFIFSSDKIEVIVEEKIYFLDSDNVLFVESNQNINILSDGGAYNLIFFNGELATDVFNLNVIEKQTLAIGIDDDLKKTLLEFIDSYQDRNRVDLYILGLFYQILFFVDKQVGTSVYENNHIKTAIKYMEVNYMQNIGIVDIASSCRLSPNYLTNLFDRELGVSPIQYLIGIRMTHAKNLLITRRFTLQEIAIRVGYKTASYLSQSFKKFYGISPKEFLNNN